MTWDTFETTLFGLGKIVFIIYFLMFVMSVAIERKVSSTVIALMVLAVANGAMTALTPMLYEVASSPELFYKFLWYAVFALIDGIAIFLLFKFHNLLKQSVGRIANLIGFVFLLLASIQTLRFIDRFVSNTDYFQLIYQYGVPLLNVAMVPAIMLLWLLDYKANNKKLQAVLG